MTVTEEQLRAAAKILAAKALETAGTLLAPAPAAAPATAPAPAPHHDPKANGTHHGLLLDGFNALAVAAKNGGGKTLDSMKVEGDLEPADRTLLEHVRRVFIDAQAGPAERKKAVAAWPSVETKLHQAVTKARAAGVPVEYCDTTEDNIAVIAESYIHAAHKGPVESENDFDYVDVVNGLNAVLDVVCQGIIDLTDGVEILNLEDSNRKQQAALAGVKFGTNLNKRHHQLLEDFRQVFVLVRTAGRAHDAVAAWNHINEDITHVLKGAAQMKVTSTVDLAARINKLHHDLIEGNAFYEDHQKAMGKVKVSDPNDKLAAERLKAAVLDLEKVDELSKKAGELGAKAVLQGVFEQKGMNGELAGLLFEYVHGTFEIHELIEEWKKKGLIGKSITIASLADKVVSISHAGAEAVFHYIKDFAEDALKTAVEEAAEEWKAIGKWAEKNLETLEKVGKAALIVTVVVSAIKVVDLISHGHYAAAAKEALSTAVGVGAGVAGGAAGSAMFAGIAVTVDAEIEAFKGYAAMIQYAKEENEKAALGDFFGAFEFAVGEAQQLVAGLENLATITDKNELKIAEQSVVYDLEGWTNTMSDLSDQVNTDRKDRVGGQPEFLEKIGPAAVAAMKTGVPATTAEALGKQVETVFAGANALAAWLAQERADQREAAEKARKEAEEEEKE